MEQPQQNIFALLPDEIKLPIIQFIATGNTIEEAVRNIRAFAATNREFRRLASDPKLTEVLIKQLIGKFPQETNNDPVFAAAILDTPGAKEWLTKNHPNWLESLNTYAFGMIFRAGSPNNKWDILSSLLENKQILDGVIRRPDVLVHLVHSSDAKVVQIARKLLEKGKVDPNKTTANGRTPLMQAALGNFDLVNLLLEFDAKPNMQDQHGNTALTYAIARYRFMGTPEEEKQMQSEAEQIVRKLLQEGANPNIAEKKNGDFPLILATHLKYGSVIKDLLEYGADPNKQTYSGSTALHVAVAVNNIELVKILLEHDANPNLTAKYTLSRWQYTPLMDSAQRNNLPIVKLLLEHGANPNLKTHESNGREYTAADLARQKGHEEMAKFLEQAMKQYKERYGL